MTWKHTYKFLTREIRYTKEYYKKLQRKIEIKEERRYGTWTWHVPYIEGKQLHRDRSYIDTFNSLCLLERTAVNMMDIVMLGKDKASKLNI